MLSIDQTVFSKQTIGPLEFFLTLFYALFFIFLIHKIKFFELQELSKSAISYVFLLKIGCGVLLWIIYTYYYTDRNTSDIFKFYDDAKYIYQALPEHPLHYLQMVLGINTDADDLKPYYSQMHNWYRPWEGAKFHDNKLIIQFNALVYLFSFGYYNVHTVFMCFLSLIGLTGIYKTFSPLVPGKRKELAVAVFLVPSVLFWASGVLKEGIIIFALGMLIYNINKCLYGNVNRIRYCLFFLLSALLLFLAKMYVFVAIAPVIVSLVIVRFTSSKFVFLKFISVHLLFFLIAVNLYRLNTEWDIMLFLHQKQMGFIQTAISEKAGSYININYLKPNVMSLIKNAPQAIFNSMFRPHLFESKSVFIMISALENMFLFILLIITVLFFKKPDKEVLPWLYACVFFAVMLSLLIGLVTPVLGSIARYRVPIIPFFTTSLIILLDKNKLKKRLFFFIKKNN